MMKKVMTQVAPISRTTPVLTAALLLAAGSARAADLNWQGTGSTTTTTDFNLNTNWQNGTLPGSSDIGFFSNTSGTLNSDVTAAITIGGLAFSTGTHIVSSIGGFAITLTSNANSTNPRPAFYGFSAGQTETVSADLILAPTSGGISYFYGNSATSNFILSGDISGAAQIYMQNGGVYTFSGNNSFAGGVVVASSANSVNIGSATALGTGIFQISTGAGSNNQTITNSSGGALTLTNALTFARGQTSQSTTFTGSDLTFNGAVTLLNANSATTTLIVNNTLTLGGVVKHTGYTNGALIKDGSGTLTLGGANTYTGGTTVAAGKILVSNTTGSGTGTGAVTVNSGATLGGTGTISGTVTVNGSLAPGNSIGTISTGNLAIGATGALDVELGRSGTTPTSDRTNVTGTVTFSDGADLKLTLYSGLDNAELGDIFYLISNNLADAIVGEFTKLNGTATTLSEGSLFSWNSRQWQITYLADYSTGFTGGNDLAIQVVPEPAALALLCLGGVGLLRRRRNG
ncbi:MAG: autotransporter-associated beta strand repeat-containing protein [Lentisphaeria bacterium]